MNLIKESNTTLKMNNIIFCSVYFKEDIFLKLKEIIETFGIKYEIEIKESKECIIVCFNDIKTYRVVFKKLNIEFDYYHSLAQSVYDMNNVKNTMGLLDFLNWNHIHVRPWVNFISIFSQRIETLVESIMLLLSQKSNILIYYALRDITECIEIISYLMINKSKIFNEDGSINEIYSKIMKMVQGSKKMEKYDLKGIKGRVLESQLALEYKNNCLEKDFDRAIKIKNKCNDVIHKNGINNVIIHELHYRENMVLLQKIFSSYFTHKTSPFSQSLQNMQ